MQSIEDRGCGSFGDLVVTRDGKREPSTLPDLVFAVSHEQRFGVVLSSEPPNPTDEVTLLHQSSAPLTRLASAQLTDLGIVIERKGHPAARRIGLIAIGAIMVLAGMVAWGWETEYGYGHGFSVEVIGDQATVYDTDEDADNVVVFEGTKAEADAYVDEQRTSGRNYTVSVLILTAGGALLLVGVRPRKKHDEAPQSTSDEAGP